VPDRSLSAPTSSTPEHSAHRARLIVESCIETELCAALDDIAVSNFDPATRPYGGGDDVIVGGYRRLVDALAFAADIRPNSEVQRVVQRRTTVTAGLSDRTEFVSAGAIITVPLGVLKASSITFEPALPPLFTAAIGQLGFGRFEKVFLQFDHRWWTDSDEPNGLYLLDAGVFRYWLDISTTSAMPTLVAHIASGEWRPDR
jgi:monoamine oxidase